MSAYGSKIYPSALRNLASIGVKSFSIEANLVFEDRDET